MQNAKLYSIANKNETNLDDVVLGSGQTASGKFNTTTVTNNNGRAEIVDGIVKYERLGKDKKKVSVYVVE